MCFIIRTYAREYTIKISGGYSAEVTPVPISNTEVKLCIADGTAWETVWESRLPPDYY